MLVIEGDLRRPTMPDYFPVDHSVGLTDLIVGRARLEQAVQRWGNHDLWVLPSGHLPPNPSELLASDAMARLLAELRERFGAIIINTPPLLPVTDAAVLSAHADGVIVVVRAGKTTRHQLTQAIRSLNAVGARVLGTVMNMVPTPRGSGYSSYPAAPDTSAVSPCQEVSTTSWSTPRARGAGNPRRRHPRRPARPAQSARAQSERRRSAAARGPRRGPGGPDRRRTAVPDRG